MAASAPYFFGDQLARTLQMMVLGVYKQHLDRRAGEG